MTATVSYNPNTDTTATVVATINTNKRVNKVEGWTLSEDGKKLTKEFTTNTTEIVHLVDMDGMTKDVEVKVTNIKKEAHNGNSEGVTNNGNLTGDDTTAKGKLPQTGVDTSIIIISVIIVMLMSIISYKIYNNYKDIK